MIRTSGKNDAVGFLPGQPLDEDRLSLCLEPPLGLIPDRTPPSNYRYSAKDGCPLDHESPTISLANRSSRQ
ncbi:MAG TPA: hypothetical protein DEO88_08780 [Syntrophobacteraceae bacterium]|jgi:hypothetical protein|nr:hypothetical protein [Syntrophobacteraceae bacterium]